MATVNIPFVDRFRVKGRWYHYYRRGAVRRRLPGEPGSAEWQEAYSDAAAVYAAALAGVEARPGSPAHAPGSIGALIASYRGTTAWSKLAPASRADYEKGLGWLERGHAHRPASTMRRPHVIKLRELAAWDIDPDTRERTMVPSRANKMLTMLSVLMEHAQDLGWRDDNPARGVRKIKLEGEGYRPWTPAEIALFLRAHRDDALWKLALTLALCTGQRGQDLAAMQWGAYDGAAIEVVQEKTGAKVWIPAHPQLQAALSAAPKLGLFLLMRPDRRPVKPGRPPRPMTQWPVNAFQKAAGDAIATAGLTGVVWHGLRATAASWMAEGGCSDAEIMSITGHTTANMAQRYRRGARQKVLATAAVGKMRMQHEQG